MKHFFTAKLTIFFSILVFCASTSAETRKFVMLLEPAPVAMVYKRGLLFNKWHPLAVDGFYIGEAMSFKDFSNRFYIQNDNPAYKLRYFPASSNSEGSCRIKSRSTSKGKSLQFYRGNVESRVYLVMDDREDYLKFSCIEE